MLIFFQYCDYYRPKFFILENVATLANAKLEDNKSYLVLILRALVSMGYQCTFANLQAGNFGVAQSRARCFVLAAAPGMTLPAYPDPLYTFSNHNCSLNVQDLDFNSKSTKAAPYRHLTVRDAISDLPGDCKGRKHLDFLR